MICKDNQCLSTPLSLFCDSFLMVLHNKKHLHADDNGSLPFVFRRDLIFSFFASTSALGAVKQGKITFSTFFLKNYLNSIECVWSITEIEYVTI